MQRTSYVSPIAYDEGPMYGNAGTTYIPVTQSAQKYALLLSENFSFLIVSLIYFAMFKIKSSRYQDLILNSTGCRGSNRLSRQPQVLDTHLHASTLFAIRNSQFAIRNSQFAIRSSQFAVRSSQFAVRSIIFSDTTIFQSQTALRTVVPYRSVLYMRTLCPEAACAKIIIQGDAYGTQTTLYKDAARTHRSMRFYRMHESGRR